MLPPDHKARVIRAAGTSQALGITQSEIAKAVGASQGQVSRILAAKTGRATRLSEEVCLDVERRDTGITADAVRAKADLIEALQTTWDGSATHAKALATVIRSLAGLGGPCKAVKKPC